MLVIFLHFISLRTVDHVISDIYFSSTDIYFSRYFVNISQAHSSLTDVYCLKQMLSTTKHHPQQQKSGKFEEKNSPFLLRFQIFIYFCTSLPIKPPSSCLSIISFLAWPDLAGQGRPPGGRSRNLICCPSSPSVTVWSRVLAT